MEVSTVHLLHLLSGCADKAFADELEGERMTPRQYEVLAAVARREGLSQAEIIEATGIDRASVADLVARLIGRGWLRRRRNRANLRAYNIFVTPDGRRAYTFGLHASARASQVLLSRISAPDAVRLLRTVRRLVPGAA